MNHKRLDTATRQTISVCEIALGFCLIALGACTDDRDGPANLWGGSVDTLPSGTIVVHNPSFGVWDSSTAWHIEEELRIGTLEGSGPELFGSIAAIEVDSSGRIYVFESQTQELRVFDSSGNHVRTIGREGGGPGEFKQGIGLAWAPDGNLWVVDPGNVRISVFDTAGSYLTMKRIMGGYVMMPWPGRFDREGRFYHYGLDLSEQGGGLFVMVRHDTSMQPLDTVQVPQPREARFFEIASEGGRVTAGIPYSASVTSRIGPNGDLWFARTGDYRVIRRSVTGDSLLVISRDFEPLPVTSEEIDSAIAGLEWFTRQGGRIDRSRFPRTKPALSRFYIDDADQLWVVPVTVAENAGRLLDVFESTGRYLGRIRLPFMISSNPIPLFRRDYIYCVTIDELGVPYVVRARIVKP